MKLLFDESLSPGWFHYYATCSLNRKARFEMGLPVLAIGGFWNTLQHMVSSWSRLTAILSVCCSSSLALKSSFCVPAIIQPRSRLRCFAGMRSASLNCLLRGIN